MTAYPLIEAVEAVVACRIVLGDLPPHVHLGAEDTYVALEEKAYVAARAQYDDIVEEVIAQLEAAGQLPSDPLQRDLVLQTLREGLDDMTDEFVGVAMESAQAADDDVVRALAEQGVDVSTDGTIPTGIAEEIQQQVKTFSDDTLAHLVGDVDAALAQAAADGLGIDAAAVRLREEFVNLADHRLRLIARTEINGAQGRMSYESMRQYNVAFKMWITARDRRVRDEHKRYSLHGQTVRMDEKFTNGLRYPHDRRGDIKQWINCRCRMRPWIPPKDDGVPESTPIYPSP